MLCDAAVMKEKRNYRIYFKIPSVQIDAFTLSFLTTYSIITKWGE